MITPCVSRVCHINTVELVEHAYSITVDVSWLFTARRSTVTLQLHYWRFVVDLCTTCSRTVDTARRAVPLQWQTCLSPIPTILPH